MQKKKGKLMFDKKRPVSWSFISAFEYNPEDWYKKYVLLEQPSSKEMTFGSLVDKKIQADPSFMPDLPRYPHMQFSLTTSYNKIPLVGFPDGLCLGESNMPNLKNFKIFWQNDFLLSDYKTGKKAWDQDRADETGQLTMYLLLIYAIKKIPPEKFTCYIHWLPTQDNGDFTITLRKDCKPVTIKTKRTMRDLARFAQRIERVLKQAEQYCLNHE